MGDVNNNDLDFVEIVDDEDVEDVDKDEAKEDQSVNKSNNKEKDNNKKENLSEEEKKKAVKREVFSWIRLLAIAVAVALCINYLILFNGYVPSGSMYPTIEADGSQGA
ncbi:MAG: S26 family signal peptidase, partial [Parasporobacterium sp.]|nr:S26 family signal peptidase [Parasporobacterium sp.]